MNHNLELQNLIYSSLQDFPVVQPVNLDTNEDPWTNQVFKNKVCLTSIHSGSYIPECFQIDPKNKPLNQEITAAYQREKDWGADLLCRELAIELGLNQYYLVNIARVLMDFGRFPGITDKFANHMNRYTISGIFSDLLTHEQKRKVLELCYDNISKSIDSLIANNVLMLNIHSYDKYNPGPDGPYAPTCPSVNSIRHPIALVSRPMNFYTEKRMPFNIFDPSYPDSLCEMTADPKLLSRISLTLSSISHHEYEENLGTEWDGNKFAVGINYPYDLPDGSVEVRSQVWSFFQYVKNVFEDTFPANKDKPSYNAVWKMLLDTNLRDSSTVALKSYIHMFRKEISEYYYMDSNCKTTYKDVLLAYQDITNFIGQSSVIDDYKNSPIKFQALAIEVRKDLVWEFHDELSISNPKLSLSAAKMKTIKFIAKKLAYAITKYINHDSIVNNDWLD